MICIARRAPPLNFTTAGCSNRNTTNATLCLPAVDMLSRATEAQRLIVIGSYLPLAPPVQAAASISRVSAAAAQQYLSMGCVTSS